MERENILNKNMCDYSKAQEIIQIILISIGALAVPTFLGKILVSIFGQNSFIGTHSQIIVGSIVNTALIITAINVKGWKKIARNNHTSKHFSNTWWICIYDSFSIYSIYDTCNMDWKLCNCILI